MAKEVQKKEETTKAVVMQHAKVPEAPILRTDILVPYVILAQGTSDSVKERKAQLGDIVRSTNAEKLGDPDKALDVIFLHYPKANWVIEQKTGNRFEYRKTIPRDANNETLEWKYWGDDEGNEVAINTRGATEWRRVKQLMVFALLPRDIEAAAQEMAKLDKGELPDPSKALTPVIFSFRSSSYKAGKEICTFYTQAQSMNVPIWRYALPLSDFLDKNDEGSFYVWKVDRTKTKPVSKDSLAQVEQWARIVSQNAESLKTDETAENEAVRPVTEVKEQVC